MALFDVYNSPYKDRLMAYVKGKKDMMDKEKGDD